jgi:hypothetical protein
MGPWSRESLRFSGRFKYLVKNPCKKGTPILVPRHTKHRRDLAIECVLGDQWTFQAFGLATRFELRFRHILAIEFTRDH